MPDYRKFPLEFAMGILQLRQTLAQKRADIDEIRAQRQQEAELANARMRLEAMGMAMQGAQHQASVEAQKEIAAGEQETRKSVAEAQLKLEGERIKDERAGQLNTILDKVSQGQPVYVPPWALGQIKPEALRGPVLTDAAGAEQKDEQGNPRYQWTAGLMDGPPGVGGRFVVPLTNARMAAEFQKLQAEESQRRQTSLLTEANRRKAEALTQKYKAAMASVGALTPQDRAAAISNFQKLQEAQQQRALKLKSTGQTQEGRMVENDPTYGMNEKDAEMYNTAQAVYQAIMGNYAAALKTPLQRFEANEAIRDIYPEKGEPDLEARALLDQREFTGFTEMPVHINPQTNEWEPMNMRARSLGVPPPGRVRGSVKYWAGPKGLTGWDLFSGAGQYIRSEGRTPRSAPTKVTQNAPAAQNTLPLPAAPTVEGPASREMIRAQIDVARKRLAAMPRGDPQEKAATEELMALIAALQRMGG